MTLLLVEIDSQRKHPASDSARLQEMFSKLHAGAKFYIRHRKDGKIENGLNKAAAEFAEFLEGQLKK